MKQSQLPALALAVLTAACSHRLPQPEVPSAVMPPPPSTTVQGVSAGDPQPRSLDQLLAGKLSGVTVSPGATGGILVRMMGPTSFGEGREGPLFVVDGTVVEAQPNGALPWLNPQDVESITALKNPAELAIYGSRGANGVIVIKTKKGHR